MKPTLNISFSITILLLSKLNFNVFPLTTLSYFPCSASAKAMATRGKGKAIGKILF